MIACRLTARTPRLRAAGVLAALAALLAAVSVVRPSASNVVPFINGVLEPSTATVAPTTEAVPASTTSPTPFVNGILEPAVAAVSPTVQAVTSSGQVATRAGVHGVHPHRLRHTAAVTFLRAGGDAFALQRILGHSTLAMTRNYVALTDTDIKAAHLRASPADRLYHGSKR
jgi:hypothetical protein